MPVFLIIPEKCSHPNAVIHGTISVVDIKAVFLGLTKHDYGHGDKES